MQMENSGSREPLQKADAVATANDYCRWQVIANDYYRWAMLEKSY